MHAATKGSGSNKAVWSSILQGLHRFSFRKVMKVSNNNNNAVTPSVFATTIETIAETGPICNAAKSGAFSKRFGNLRNETTETKPPKRNNRNETTETEIKAAFFKLFYLFENAAKSGAFSKRRGFIDRDVLKPETTKRNHRNETTETEMKAAFFKLFHLFVYYFTCFGRFGGFVSFRFVSFVNSEITIMPGFQMVVPVARIVSVA